MSKIKATIVVLIIIMFFVLILTFPIQSALIMCWCVIIGFLTLVWFVAYSYFENKQ